MDAKTDDGVLFRDGDHTVRAAANGSGYWTFWERDGRGQIMHPWGHPHPTLEAAQAACRWLTARDAWRQGGCRGPCPGQPREIRS